MNNTVSKIIAGALASVMIFESCTRGEYMSFSAEDINEAINETNASLNSIALPINVNFSKEDARYLLFLQKLAQDIIVDPHIAKEFISNPISYCRKNGFNDKHIAMDAQMTKIILSLADEEIMEAASTGDIPRYLGLLKDRGIIDTVSVNLDVALSRKGDINNVNVQVPRDEVIDVGGGSLSACLVYGAVLVGVAAVVWAVVVEHFAAANAVGALTAIAWTVAAVTDGGRGASYGLVDSLSDSDMVRIWMLTNGEMEHVPKLIDQYTKDIVESTLNYIRNNHPQEYEKYDEAMLRNIIMLNI